MKFEFDPISEEKLAEMEKMMSLELGKNQGVITKFEPTVSKALREQGVEKPNQFAITIEVRNASDKLFWPKVWLPLDMTKKMFYLTKHFFESLGRGEDLNKGSVDTDHVVGKEIGVEIAEDKRPDAFQKYVIRDFFLVESKDKKTPEFNDDLPF